MSLTRRGFLVSSTAASVGLLAGATPDLHSVSRPQARATGRVVGANDRIRLGAIGTGGRGQYLLRLLQQQPNQELVAVCDVYAPRRRQALKYAIAGADQYEDYRRLLERNNIDAVVIAAPDHQHAALLLAAVAAGKDVYCEKPMTHRVEEGPRIVEAVTASGRVVQTGTQQRSWPHWLLAGDVIRSGQLGDITFVHTYWYQSYGWGPQNFRDFQPGELDAAAWLGAAPSQPVTPLKYHYWRWFWDFGGGALTDLMTHWIDMVQDYLVQPAPARLMTSAHNKLHPDWQCPDTVNCNILYPNGVTAVFTCTMCSSIDDGGVEIRGTRATLKIDRERLLVLPEGAPHLPHQNAPEPELIMLSQHDGTIDHIANFLDCMRTRKLPNANVQVGMEAARTSHLGNLSLRNQRAVEWDAQRGAVLA